MKIVTSLLVLAVSLLFLSSVSEAQQWAGTYTTTISEADVPPDMKAAVGNWSLILGDEGQFTTLQNGEVVVRGTYAVTADQMTFSDSDGAMACAREQAAGSYGFVLDAGTLTFKLLDDDCAGRRIILLTRPLTREQNPSN